MNLEELKLKIAECLDKLYCFDNILFTRNKGRGLCERCLVFRFSYYLQLQFEANNFFVDCDFNSSNLNGQGRFGKQIVNQNGLGSTGRFVDIIIHKRTFNQETDFICFEIKKWNNYDKKASRKDANNLEVLTTIYHYKYGFHITLGKNRESTKCNIWENGKLKNSNKRDGFI